MTTKKKPQDAVEQNDQEIEQNDAQMEQETQEPEVEAVKEPEVEAVKEPEAEELAQDEFANLPNPCVYCGPTVRGVARQYTTYMGGIPEPLKEFIREHPEARALIVSTGRFAAVRKRLETHGTAEAIVYKKVKSEL